MTLHQWITDKPDKPCVFIARNKIREFWDYNIWILDYVDGIDTSGQDAMYLAILTGQGDEWGDYSELEAEGYFIVEELDKSGERS
ncbi:MAG: hypothetical protein KGJ90_02495 [Patescibacteria group bacterium]|nr:hypothetical protein [Patescibacteria group bacterium]